MAIALGILLLHRSQPNKLLAPVLSVSIETNKQAKLSTIRRDQFSGNGMADFINRFEKRFNPEIAYWCKVYEGRLPFNKRLSYCGSDE